MRMTWTSTMSECVVAYVPSKPPAVPRHHGTRARKRALHVAHARAGTRERGRARGHRFWGFIHPF